VAAEQHAAGRDCAQRPDGAAQPGAIDRGVAARCSTPRTGAVPGVRSPNGSPDVR